MRVSIDNNRVLVVTDIDKVAVMEGYITPVVKDDKGNELYRIAVNTEGAGKIGMFGCVINTFSEDKAAISITVDMDATPEQIKRQYGKALLNLKKFTEIIAAAAAEEAAAVEELFS